MEELNESKTAEVLESEATVEEFEIKEVSLADTTEAPKEKKAIDWLKVGVAGTLACSVLSMGLSCAALIKKSNDAANQNNQSSSNVNDSSSVTISEDGYFVIDGTKTNIKADGSSSEIVDAQIVPVDKWGISTYMMFTFSDGSYVTTQPKVQVLNDHYYDAASADDFAILTETYAAPKVRLTSNINVTSALEFGSSVEINLNNKTFTYAASAPIEVADEASVKFANGNVTFSTAKAMVLGESASLEIADATVSAQGHIAEVVGDNAKVEIVNATIETTGKVVDVADTANNFETNFTGSTLNTADAGNVYVSTEASLRDAIANTEVTSITLTSNIDVETGVYVRRNVTVDLNGKTLTSTQNSKVNGIFTVFTGATLTIEGNGIINSACQTNDYSMAIWAYGGEVVINGGTFTNIGAKDHDGTGANNNELIYVSNGGKVTINAGTFVGNSENETHGAKYTLNAVDGATNAFVVKGGTFVAYNPTVSESEYPAANFVADGYKVVENNGVYTVVEAEGYVYASSEAEINAALANEEATTIVICGNINLASYLTVNRQVTFELNNCTITRASAKQTIAVMQEGDLTINGNGTISGYTSNNSYWIAVWVYGGKATINGGTFTNEGTGADAQYDLMYASFGGELVINGGEFKGKTPAWILNIKDSDRETTSITVKGGKFYGLNPSISAAEGVGTNFVADGYKVVENNGVYTVVEAEGYVYASSEAEINAALANEEATTIVICGNINLASYLTVNRKVTFELNNCTITRASAKQTIAVMPEGDLTINGNGTISGYTSNNNYWIAVWVYGGKATINGGTFTNEGTGADAQYDLMYASFGGELVINGGEFKSKTPAWILNIKDSDRETTSITVKGGKFYGLNPSISAAEGVGTNFVAEGYTVVEDNGVFTVVAE